MTDTPYRTGGVFLLISAALHIIAPVLSGFASASLMLAGVGIVYVILTAGLMRGMRWVAYIVFLVMLIGLNGAISGYFAPGATPAWLYLGIIIANIACIVFLFGALWRAAPARTT